MNNYKMRKFIKFLGFVVIMAIIAGGVVTLLWNALLPGILGVGKITILQGFGLLVLSRILFGGFPRKRWDGGHGRHRQWRSKMREKWENMSPEEREKFKERFPWKHRNAWKEENKPVQESDPES